MWVLIFTGYSRHPASLPSFIAVQNQSKRPNCKASDLKYRAGSWQSERKNAIMHYIMLLKLH